MPIRLSKDAAGNWAMCATLIAGMIVSMAIQPPVTITIFTVTVMKRCVTAADGRFELSIFKRLVSLPCPEIPPAVGDACSDQGLFTNGTIWKWLQLRVEVLPWRRRRLCLQIRKIVLLLLRPIECSDHLTVQCTGDKSAKNCPSVCPKMPPKTNDALPLGFSSIQLQVHVPTRQR